jgi:glucose-6-phosphate 1-dehydrogenase
MPAADPAHYVRGQYDGYREIAGVAPDSTTETYAAMRLEIDNWRWEGVPFFIRTGKHLPITQTELRLIFRRPPQLLFHGDRSRRPSPASWWSGSTLDRRQAARGGAARGLAEGASSSRSTRVRPAGGEGPRPTRSSSTPRMLGDSTRFTRQDTSRRPGA